MTSNVNKFDKMTQAEKNRPVNAISTLDLNQFYRIRLNTIEFYLSRYELIVYSLNIIFLIHMLVLKK